MSVKEHWCIEKIENANLLKKDKKNPDKSN